MIKARNRKSLPIKIGAVPTTERRHHNGGVFSEVIDRDANGKVFMKRYRAVWECPLDAYRDHKLISDREYRAGLRFHEAYYGAVICRKQQFHPVSKNQASQEPTMSDRLLNEAYKAVQPEDMATVVDTCGHSIAIWSPKALEKLRRGLGHLVIQWNISAIEVCEHKKLEA